jgi:tyrosine-protein kinase Etk/Wzc
MAEKQTPSRSDDDIDLSELLGVLQDHKWLIGVVTALFFAISVAYALLATPIYQANAVVQVEQKTPQLPGLADLTQTLGASSSEATTEMALLTSRTVLGQAIDKLNLTTVAEPRHFPLIGAFMARRFNPAQDGDVAPARFGLDRYDWGGASIDIFRLKVPKRLLGQPLVLVAGAHGAYVLQDDSGNTLVRGQAGQPASGHGIELQVRSLAANPGTRFDVVEMNPLILMTTLQQDIVTIEQGKGSGIIALTYLNADADLATNLLDRVSEIYVRQNVERNSEEAASSLKFVREQLPNVRRELEKATAALNAFQTRAHSVDVTMQTQGLLSQAVSVEASIQQLRMQQVDMQRHFTPEHPAYKALLSQIGQLQAQKAAIDKQVGVLPDTQQELLRLSRDVQVSNETYTSLLNQAQQLDIARAGTVGNVHIVDKAVTAVDPVKPRKLLVVLGGTLLGAILVIAFVFVRQMLKRGVEDPAVIEQLGLPVYAAIPMSTEEKAMSVKHQHGARSRDGRQHLLAVTAPADLAVEALRSLRTSLHFARLEAKNNLLMISGASPDAGKTFVSSNLAAVIAQGDQRVLLIDADMRKGAQHQVLGGRPERGLSELIAGQIDIETAIRPVNGVEGLHFIARGKVPPNPSELLMHPSFAAVLEKLLPMYDLVIIDTPPILAVTDAAVIGHHAGTTLLVVRFGLNQPREIALAKQRFEQNNVVVKGTIFNAVERRSTGYYSYAYYEYKAEK